MNVNFFEQGWDGNLDTFLFGLNEAVLETALDDGVVLCFYTATWKWT